VHIEASPDIEAQAFMATVYGAMPAARALDDPERFDVIVETLFRRIRA